MRFSILFAVLAVGLSLAGLPHPLFGETLRIESQFFAPSQEEPVSQSTTFFQDGIVYDFRTNPNQVTIYKQKTLSSLAKFVLLDSQRKLRTEIPLEEIDRFMNSLREWASKHSDPLLQFAANPKFEEKFQDHLPGDHGELLMTSKLLQYRLTTVAARDDTLLPLYREFNDSNAKLNTMVHVGSTPPFPRLVVSQAMANRKVLAEKVELTIRSHKSLRTKDMTMRAIHEIRWRFSKQDRQRIEAAQADLVQFQPMSYDAYRQAQIKGKTKRR